LYRGCPWVSAAAALISRHGAHGRQNVRASSRTPISANTCWPLTSVRNPM